MQNTTKHGSKIWHKPRKYIPELNDQFLKAQSASGVEVVTGATHSSESFQNYAQQLIQAAQAGNTDTIEIDNGADLKDGTYKLEEKNYSNGYRVQFEMTVAGGKVTESNFDYIDKDGKSKQDDTEYNENMKAKAVQNQNLHPYSERRIRQSNGRRRWLTC